MTVRILSTRRGVDQCADQVPLGSNTPEMGQKTCDKIKGGKHQAMKGLGHFPATENPKVFVGYLLEAVEHIQKTGSF